MKKEKSKGLEGAKNRRSNLREKEKRKGLVGAKNREQGGTT